MTRALKPYKGISSANNTIYKCDTGTDDAGSAFQAYIDTKPLAPFGRGFSGGGDPAGIS